MQQRLRSNGQLRQPGTQVGGLGFAGAAVRPTGKSVATPCVNLSSPFRKNISVFPKPKSALYHGYPVPREGRWPSSRTLGRDAVDAAASGVKRDGRAGSLGICERSNGALTNGAVAYGEVVWS